MKSHARLYWHYGAMRRGKQALTNRQGNDRQCLFFSAVELYLIVPHHAACYLMLLLLEKKLLSFCFTLPLKTAKQKFLMPVSLEQQKRLGHRRGTIVVWISFFWLLTFLTFTFAFFQSFWWYFFADKSFLCFAAVTSVTARKHQTSKDSIPLFFKIRCYSRLWDYINLFMWLLACLYVASVKN